MSPDEAYEALHTALQTRPPECVDIDLFTTDDLTRADVEVLAPICASCDLRLLCRRYAETAKVTAGYWAGTLYGGKARAKAA